MKTFSVSTLAALAIASLASTCINAAPATTAQLQERQSTFTAAFIATLVGDAINRALGGKAADDSLRRRATLNIIDALNTEFPTTNRVVIHTDHDYTWNGEQGDDKDWIHDHKEIDVQLGGTVGYEIYVSKVGGDFMRNGDGDSVNWRWQGAIDEDTSNIDDGHLVFIDP